MIINGGGGGEDAEESLRWSEADARSHTVTAGLPGASVCTPTTYCDVLIIGSEIHLLP